MSIFDWVKIIVPIDQITEIASNIVGDAFAEAGAAAYVAASKKIAADNLGKGAEEISQKRKDLLRPNFGPLVDTVRVTFGAKLINGIDLFGVKFTASKLAQTFGDRIYVGQPNTPGNDVLDDVNLNQLIQLAHEMVHVRQYHNRGKSLHDFGKDYFRGFYDAGFDDKKNRMEVEASDFHKCFQTRLFSGIIIKELFRSTLLTELTSFMPFKLNAQQHFLSYKSSSGAVRIARINLAANSIDTIFMDQWTSGWTSFVPFLLGGKPHYLAYKSGSGQVDIDRIRPDGSGVDTIWQASPKWTAGWTSFLPFTLGGKPHYLAYKLGSGEVDIDRIRPDGQGVDTIWQASPKWTTGWTSFVPFVLNGEPHYLAYKVGTGTVHIDRIRPGGDGIDNVWKGQWTKGWSSMIAFDFKGPNQTKGTPHILTYKNGTGYVHLESINDGGLGTTTVWCDQWTKGWTAFFPFTLNGKPFHLAYKKDAGTVAIDSVALS